MHESKLNSSTRGSSSASSIKSNQNNNTANNSVTSSARSDNNNNSEINRKGKKKSNRDRQQTSNDDGKPASVMSNLSSYSLIDDDHIDDQETINVGNLIIDLESDLEKEKIENEQANHNISENNHAKFSQKSSANAPSSTSSTKTNSNNRSNANTNQDSRPNITKSGHKSNAKHLNSNSIASNSSNEVISTNNNGHATARTIFKSSADERGELKMKITRETKPEKSDHKLLLNQKSPTSSSVSGANLNRSTKCENDGRDDNNVTNQSSSISSTKECGTSTSVGTITEPECLGPCEPGTSVTLEGIVWQETDGGILVVNVTWRGKTYVGALLDCTRHDWAPPRLCDSPASDIDLKSNKGVRAKRIVTRSNGNNILDEKTLLQTTGKLRNGKGRRIPAPNEPTPSCSKRQRDTPATETSQVESNTPQTNTSSSEIINNPQSEDNENGQNDSISTSNILMDKAGPNSPTLIGCEEPNCSKKYRNINGLLYHQAHAHGSDNNESYNSQDDRCSSSTKDKQDNKNVKSEAPLEQDRCHESLDRTSPNIAENDIHQQVDHQLQHGQKRQMTPTPEANSKVSKLANSPLLPSIDNASALPPDTSNSFRRIESERRHSNTTSTFSNTLRPGDSSRRSPGAPPARSIENQQNSSLNSGHQPSKLNPSSSKQSNPIPPPLPVATEEGMKPSGTSTGPPPAPHQANCYFNPAFLANTFNPYALPPYFPRSMYDPMAPPTSNAAFLTRFMSNMRAPPPSSDSSSRLLSPSLPKNLPFPPFKVDPGIPQPPPPLPTSSLGGHPMQNLSPHIPNPQHPPPPPHPSNQVPQLPPVPPHPAHPPPPTLGSASPNLRMPSQVDPLLPPSSQPAFLPPTSLSSYLGIPGLPNPLASIGAPHMTNLVDDPLAKQFPRRYA